MQALHSLSILRAMKQLTLISLAIIALLSSPLFAGPPDFKQVAPAPPPCDFGTGWYVALDGGANVSKISRTD
jgi:hypothetical protein